jgi:hypothetical protein
LADFNTFIPVMKMPNRPIDTFGGKMVTSIEYVEQFIHSEDYATVLPADSFAVGYLCQEGVLTDRADRQDQTGRFPAVLLALI